jgi:hypothetical protein
VRRLAALAIIMAIVAGCAGGPARAPGAGGADDAGSSGDVGPSGSAAVTESGSASPDPDASGLPDHGPTEAPPASTDPPPTPRPTARPQPSVVPRVHGLEGSFVVTAPDHLVYDDTLTLEATDLSLDDCTVEHRYAPAWGDPAPYTRLMPALAAQPVSLEIGHHDFSVTCSAAGDTVDAYLTVVVDDGYGARCQGFEFPGGDPIPTTVEELAGGMVGRWRGCVTTPWVPVYWVELTFRAAGTYSAIAGEVFYGDEMNAMYWGTEADGPEKDWQVTEVVNGVGSGRITLLFEGGTVVHDDLHDIRLAASSLRFDLLHLGKYGPITFRLVPG